MPTLREAGYGKDGGESWFGLLAPAGTSPEAIERFDKAIAQALKEPEIVQKVHNAGMRTTYLNPADFKTLIATETKMFGDIIKRGNIKI